MLWYLVMTCPRFSVDPRVSVFEHYCIIIIKTSSTVQNGKNKVVYKLLLLPHKHLRHGKEKKTQLREATNC